MQPTIQTITERVLKEFDKEFEGWTIGILSNNADKKSPVFVNDELNKGKLKHYLSTLIPQIVKDSFKATKINEKELTLDEINNGFKILTKVSSKQSSFLGEK